MVNTVTAFTDGVGNHVSAIQWDGTAETLANIRAWTAKASVDRRGVLGVQMPGTRLNVGIGQWLVMDSNHQPQVFPVTNGQFVATYRPEATQATSGTAPGV